MRTNKGRMQGGCDCKQGGRECVSDVCGCTSAHRGELSPWVRTPITGLAQDACGLAAGQKSDTRSKGVA